MNLLRNIQIVPSTKAGTGLISTMYGPAVDMSDCEGVLFLAVAGPPAAGKTSDAFLSVQCASATGGSAHWAHYGSTVAVAAISQTTQQTMIAGLDFYKPVMQVPSSIQSRHYARACLHHTTGFIHFVSIKYGLRNPGATGWYSSGVRSVYGTVVGATKNT